MRWIWIISSASEDHETARVLAPSWVVRTSLLNLPMSLTSRMSWEIIPLDKRQKLEFEEEECRFEESATNDPRKRSHAQVSYEGMDID